VILVTGATGTVGREVVRGLAAQGAEFRVLARDPDRAAAALGLDADQARAGDYAAPDSLAAPLEGVERMFLVAPLSPQLAKLETNAIDAAARAGVGHVVKVSTLGVLDAGDDAPRQYPLHRESEAHLEASGLGFTHLRSGPWMQNTLNFAPSIAAEGVFRGAWGDGPQPYVDVRDLAAVAVAALTEEGHAGQAYAVTGPEALTPTDVADRLSEALGREVRYVDVPVGGAHAAMLDRGMPEWLAGAMAEVMARSREAGGAEVTQTVERVTGQAPRSYAEFAREHADRFKEEA
jgi:uncharacterized protein YbjT (DUF2867 family)